MREIKFRARNANLPRCWVYGYFVIKDGVCLIVNEDGEFKVISGSKSQSIGLKDHKSGKEIYVGDIVNCRVAKFGGEPEKRAMLQLVHYDDRGNLMMGDYCAWFCYQQEIVGNQFENPELLKEAT